MVHDAKTRCELALCFFMMCTEFDDHFRESGYYHAICFQTNWEDDANLAICIQVQSETDPGTMERHIDSFLEKMHGHFSEMEQHYFDDKQNSLLALGSFLYADIVAEAFYVWSQITTNALDFNRRKWAVIYYSQLTPYHSTVRY